jgi:hypothetical protein
VRAMTMPDAVEPKTAIAILGEEGDPGEEWTEAEVLLEVEGDDEQSAVEAEVEQQADGGEELRVELWAIGPHLA